MSSLVGNVNLAFIPVFRNYNRALKRFVADYLHLLLGTQLQFFQVGQQFVIIQKAF